VEFTGRLIGIKEQAKMKRVRDRAEETERKGGGGTVSCVRLPMDGSSQFVVRHANTLVTERALHW